jgi:hypothetical protein
MEELKTYLPLTKCLFIKIFESLEKQELQSLQENASLDLQFVKKRKWKIIVLGSDNVFRDIKILLDTLK